MSSNSFKVKNSLVLTPKNLTTLVSPEAGDIACDINDNNKIKKYDAITSSWSEVGSGAASLDNIFQLIGDDVSSWSKGNNATFLGGGSLAGTFATESVSPLNGLQSYKYTQAAGSLNDYIASPVKSVPARFRGQTCILSFPFNYNGSTNDIEVVLYDVTNSAIIPNSMFITSSSTTSVLTSYITIPTTCSSIRVGFKVAVANSGKILNFDDVQLSQTSLYTPQPESQASYYSASGVTGSTFPFLSTTPLYSVGGGLYSVSTGTVTALKKCTLSVTASVSLATTDVFIVIFRNGVDVAYDRAKSATSTILYSSASATISLNAGDVITFSSPAASSLSIALSATANSDQILTAPETFSTDTAALTYAGSGAYTLSTLQNAPVGTFITFTYAINTNTRTQTTTRPTQTDADMNSNGIQIFTRAYNAASTAGNPAAIAIQIGKGLKGVSNSLYSTSGKVNEGTLEYWLEANGTIAIGLKHKQYNERTGVLYLDAGIQASTVTTAAFTFSDLGSQSSGYLVINASKNPALTAVSTTRTGTLLRITRFTSSGTWTLPNDVGSIIVEVQGGGGTGGSGNSPGGGGGGAGGAGGYSQKLISRSSLGATETVTVGAASGTSSFGAHCSATGGSNGGGPNLNGGAGGAGSGGDINLNGNGGAGGSNAGTGGAGGASPRFGGAAPGDSSGVGTAAVANSGSGGSGGYNGVGGAGATGVVVVYEYSI